MKRIFRKIAEFLGLIKSKKVVEKKVDWKEIDKEAIFQEKQGHKTPIHKLHNRTPISTPYESMSNGVVGENGVEERDIWAKEPMKNREVLNSKKQKPTRKIPKDANDIQKLSTKYNNPNTVYRDNKGRYASLKN